MKGVNLLSQVSAQQLDIELQIVTEVIPLGQTNLGREGQIASKKFLAGTFVLLREYYPHLALLVEDSQCLLEGGILHELIGLGNQVPEEVLPLLQ